MPTKVLFVCTYWGVRSSIAKLLANSLNRTEVKIDCAGFESGTVGRLPRTLMELRGFDLPAESPQTLFNFATKKSKFDYVVTLCSQGTQENYSVLYDAVNLIFGEHSEIIHWDIPDFMAIKVTGDARQQAGDAIIQTIEDHVGEFFESICAKN
jgi:protein-tyrosine-phosphatase